MIKSIDKRLQTVKEEKDLAKRLEGKLQSAKNHLVEAREKNKRFLEILTKEKNDVEKLENISLSNLFATVLGSKAEKMDKERQEYLAAKLKYEASEKAVNELEKEIQSLSKQLEPMKNAENNYQLLIKEKEDYLKNEESYDAHQLLIYAEKEGEYSARCKELREAEKAAGNVIPTLENLLKSLDSASGWGTWDMLGGGLLTTAIKHSRIDDSKEHAALVQQQLYILQRELEDVAMSSDLEIEISGFVTFADYFFDGLIADWVVQSRIRDAREQAEGVKRQVEQLQQSLKLELERTSKELEETQRRRYELVERIKVNRN